MCKVKNRVMQIAVLAIASVLSLSACTTAVPVNPQIDASLRVVGEQLPKLKDDATLADVLQNRIESDRIHNDLMNRFRAVLRAVGVESVE